MKSSKAWYNLAIVFLFTLAMVIFYFANNDSKNLNAYKLSSNSTTPSFFRIR
jgi:hypothetical protein